MRGPTGKLVLLIVAAMLALPSGASAFTVRLTGDEPDMDIGDGNCDSDDVTAGNQCTLRAATDEANFAPNNDTITFDESVFTGNEATSTIDLGISGLALVADTEMTINGGNCGSSSSPKPCVGIEAPPGSIGLEVNGAGVDVRGLAITGGGSGIIAQAGANALTIRNSWLGLKLDQTQVGNLVGLRLFGNSAVIGGSEGKDRVVVAGNGTAGVDVEGDGNKIRRSYFGTKPDGVTEVAAGSIQIDVDPGAEGTVIGASIPSSARATTKCDGGCNVIGGAPTAIQNEGNNTTIKGNFIGLDKTGLAELPTGTQRITGGGDGLTIGGDTSAERNFITGASNGVATGNQTPGLSVKRNYFGLNSAGTAALDPPSNTAIQLTSFSSDPALVSRNRLAGAGTTGMFIGGGNARLVRNKIGLDKNGNDEPGPSNFGIWVIANDATIGEPGAGNTIGNVGSAGTHAAILIGAGPSGGDGNVVQGNYVGTDSAGAVHPNGGVGIALRYTSVSPDDNLVGGETGSSENVISNSGFDAIRLEDSTSAAAGNQFKRNRGKENGDEDGPSDLFIDIQGDDGEGNAFGPNDGIPDPIVQDGDPGDLTRSHAEGFLARDNATIYIFRTSWPNTSSPQRINAFVTKVVADGDGVWSVNFPQIPSGQRLTALQIDPDGNASELSPALDPTL